MKIEEITGVNLYFISVCFALFSNENLEVEQLPITKQKTVVISLIYFLQLKKKWDDVLVTLMEEEAIPPVY